MALRDEIRVMVVDDMATSRALLVQALESFGVKHVRAANSPVAALNDLRASPAHLVISDYNMPDLNGLEFLKELRQGARTAKIGFLLVTGRASAEIVSEGRKLGMNNMITKPFERPALLKAVEQIVGRL